MRENWVSLTYWDMEWISTTMLPQNSALDVKKYAFIIVYSKVKIALKIMPQIRQHCQPGVCWLHFFSIKIGQGYPLWGCITPLVWHSFPPHLYPHFQGAVRISFRCFCQWTTPWGCICLLVWQSFPVHLSPPHLGLTPLSHDATLAQGADLLA